MSLSNLLIALLSCPLLASVIMAIVPSKAPRSVFAFIHFLSIAATFVVSCMVVLPVFGGESAFALANWLSIDVLSAVFVSLIALIGLCTGIYSISYVKHDSDTGKMDGIQVKMYYAFFSLFMASMLLVVLSNNIIMMWVSIEVTTIATVFLVGVYRSKLALEAAWKYIIVCTVGVAFGLFGTLLVYASAENVMSDPTNAVFWTEILKNAGSLDHSLMMIAFVFALIGFGTKAGLFPMHTWLPDAHSEAPSPVSGLLSGVLLKCAMLVIIRFFILTSQCIGSGFPQTLMLILGVCSVVFAAFTLYGQHDVKRKLAYHSVENMGIIAVCLGIGGPIGYAGAIIHCVAHGLTKSMMFCLSGNLLMKYDTRDLRSIKGVMKVAPVTGVLLAAGFLGLAGFPPFMMFVSELYLMVSGITSGQIIVVILVLIAFVTVIMANVHVISESVVGEAPKNIKHGEVSALALLPELVLCAFIVWFGVAMPAPVMNAIQNSVGIIQQSDAPNLHSAFLEQLKGSNSGNDQNKSSDKEGETAVEDEETKTGISDNTSEGESTTESSTSSTIEEATGENTIANVEELESIGGETNGE